jgi:ribulose-5-phosphate 4-epimerase/fuculose-1-phosphate aldolase
MIDEGYIKFRSNWQRTPPLGADEADALIRWRQPLYRAGLIGVLPDSGIGYGNISMRVGDSDRFLISGTRTGRLEALDDRHFAIVEHYDLDANTVDGRGPVEPSSEAMTHAAIYAVDPSIRAVVHAHHHELWVRLKGSLPTTGEDVAYGTPGMARAFRRLYEESEFAANGVAVMAGHEDGLVSIGGSMQEATERILSLLQG